MLTDDFKKELFTIVDNYNGKPLNEFFQFAIDKYKGTKSERFLLWLRLELSSFRYDRLEVDTMKYSLEHWLPFYNDIVYNHKSMSNV